MRPYYEQDGIAIYHGDCRDVLPHVRADCVLTDPPYGIDHDTDYSKRKGRGVSAGKSYQPIVGDSSTELLALALSLDLPRIVWGANNCPSAIPSNDGGWIVWDKRVVESADAVLGSPIEIAWTSLTRKYRIFRIQHGGVINADGPHAAREHPSQKPLALMARCLALIPFGVVVDPFMGSGTTLVAAKRLGREAIGIETEVRYCEVAAKRLAQRVLPLEVA